MPATAHARIESLRPAAMRSKPVRMEKVFDDPDAILSLIKDRAPYPTTAAYHKLKDTMGQSAASAPWFRGHAEDDVFLNNPRWIEAAKASFDASIVKPMRCLLNLNGPTADGGAHLDLPAYRGFAAPQAPVWLLMNMTYSGLFHPWMVPIASGLAWFYRGVGGEFEYWPDGLDAPSEMEKPPLWNVGVMSDNEFMWHRVAGIGVEADQKKLAAAMTYESKAHWLGDAWEIRDGERVAIRLKPDEMRISILWKAYVFSNEDHLASFSDKSMDLTADHVVDIYLDDLRSKDIKAERPSDVFNDPAWRTLLLSAYKPPYDYGKA